MSGSASRGTSYPTSDEDAGSVPYQAPEKKAKKRAKETRSGLRRKGTSDVTSEYAETHTSPTEDDEEEDGEDVEPAGGTTSRLQADRASSNEARGSAPSAGGGDQAEVRQLAAPSAGPTVSANQPGSSVAPPA